MTNSQHRSAVTWAALAGTLFCAVAMGQDAQQPAAAKRPAAPAQPAAEPAEKPSSSAEEGLRQLSVIKVEVPAAGPGQEPRPIARIERPLLSFDDPARDNDSGTLWAWGQTGRPSAVMEMYTSGEGRTFWAYAVTLTGAERVRLSRRTEMWTPQSVSVEFQPVADAPQPADSPAGRLVQMKRLAGQLKSHEFWEPNNSRFELRLLAQPIHRYRDDAGQIIDGAVFVFANGTNPEVLVLLEAQGTSLAKASWRWGFARLGSAELHVQRGGATLWKQDRAPGVVGKSDDPYFMFFTPFALE